VYNIVEVANKIQRYYSSQEPVMPVYKEDYIEFVLRALEKYYVDRNHPEEYDESLYCYNDKEELCYDFDFNVVQKEYILILAQLIFKRYEMSDVTGDAAMSYTTNALSVTGAKEGYKSIQQEINDLENERIRVFHKLMVNDTEG